jgi:hypothetical protein
MKHHQHDQATSHSNAIVADTVPAQRVRHSLQRGVASRLRLGGARVVLSAVLLASVVLGAATWANAQSLGVPVALPQQLLTGMRARVAVSIEKRSGRTIPAYHCRHAPGGCDQRLSAFAGYLVSAANRTKLDPWLLAAMAFKESGFNPFALGSLGEMGILQINPERRDAREVRFMRDEWYRKRCRREPGACQQEVVDHAAQVLSRSFEKCGADVMDALGAYNTGRCGGNDRYAKRVLTERAELMRAAGVQTPELSFRSGKRKPRG